MRKKLRTYKIGAGLAALALVVAGCGGDGGDDGGGGDGEGGGDAAAGGDLVIWVGTGPGGDATKAIGEAFGKENGVDVTVEVVPGDKLQAQFVTASQAGDPPDVVMGAHDWIGNLVQNGTIDPIQIPEATSAHVPAAGDRGRDVQRADLRHAVHDEQHRAVPEHRPRAGRPARRSRRWCPPARAW